ncbi:MAG: rRNA maturation RNase YbeY [Chromatiales bacterium]|nr:rRNA maturation RNase YbeY [Chromatiales bacterium]MDP7093477.1 rRNA maturation RNase YbeY [Gammaproteobacteria bacterium]MDP7271585.1 rRNA maturation RNase YbeY [Gammaproteobacteria bacterium]HJP03860.1 rRNA maturation RNase YbeY [Gammaproteobacteria bacterium]
MDAVRVNLQVATDAQGLPDEVEFAAWVNAAVAAGGSASRANGSDSLVTIRVVDDKESCALNGDFRDMPRATNVLAFPADTVLSDHEQDDAELGDLAICFDVVVSEAEEQAKPVAAHMAHMTVHGTLHLLGYDHQNDLEAKVMEELETRIMKTLGFPEPYNDL